MQAILWFADKGGKLRCEEEPLKRLRRELYMLEGYDKRWAAIIMQGFKKHSVISTDRLKKFVNTAKFKEKFGFVGFD